MIKLGLQIPRFTFPGVGSDALFDTLTGIAQNAEASGFDTILVMDHFHQLPQIGEPSLEMLEGYTTLAALAPVTKTAMLSTLVTGVTYRNPAHLAKIVTTLDVVSKGRAILGIGAAWFQEEHEAYGYDFPPVRERMDRLDAAIRTIKDMFANEQSSTGAWNNPRPVRFGGPPIMVGGQGERRTLRIAAEHADLLNTNPAFDEIPRKLDVLAEHCAAIGRNRNEISVSNLGSVFIGRTHEEALDRLATLSASRGITREQLNDPATLAFLTARMYVGDPDEVGEQVSKVLDMGLDGVVVNMPADVHDAESVALVGEVLQKALAGR